MTPKTCPQCTNLIDEAVVRCPICGHPFEMEFRPANPYTTPSIPGVRPMPQMESAGQSVPWAIVAGVVAVLALAAFVFVVMIKGQQGASAELQQLRKWYSEPTGSWVSSDIDLASMDGMGEANIYCVYLDGAEFRVRKGKGAFFASKGGAFDDGFKIMTPIEFDSNHIGQVNKTAAGWETRVNIGADATSYAVYRFALTKDPGTASLVFETYEQNNVVDKGTVTLTKAKQEPTQMKHVQEAQARLAAYKKGEVLPEKKSSS